MASKVPFTRRLKDALGETWFEMEINENIAMMKRIAPMVIVPHAGRSRRKNSNIAGVNKIPCANSEMVPTIKEIFGYVIERIQFKRIAQKGIFFYRL
jgi:hypothetical protein